jgi:hypothetical protein
VAWLAGTRAVWVDERCNLRHYRLADRKTAVCNPLRRSGFAMILLTCVLTVASLTTPADNMFEFLKPEPVLDGPTACRSLEGAGGPPTLRSCINNEANQLMIKKLTRSMLTRSCPWPARPQALTSFTAWTMVRSGCSYHYQRHVTGA